MTAHEMLVDDFPALVLKAAADNSQWRQVLEAAMASCAAKVGVISLREISTAELHFPDEASTELAAPLIVGIEQEFVASYFDRFGAIDPWTSIEGRHHPHQPYFMSEYLSVSALRETEFFTGWLQPQGICECLVAEVHRSKRHWVALNLLFGPDAFARHDEIRSRVDELLPAMRLGWELSDRLIGLSYGQAASRGYLENWPAPCLILDEDFVVTSANTQGLRDFSAHIPLSAPLSVGAPLAIRKSRLREILEELRDRPVVPAGPCAVVSLPSDCAEHTIQVSSIARGEDVLGKRRAQFLVLAKPDGPARAIDARTPRIWETPGLTKMQAAVVRWIAEGGSVPNFAAEHCITKKTAYDHLLSARQKLDGISARDIYTSHQSLLMFER